MKNLLIILILTLPNLVYSQLSLNIKTFGGNSIMLPNSDFRETNLYSLYRVVNIYNDKTYEDFKEVYGMRSYIPQPIFGTVIDVTHNRLPLRIGGEITTSPSSYTKFRYSVFGGFSHDFNIIDDSYYLGIFSGIKYVIRDDGFGQNTIINSFRSKEVRDLMSSFFVSDLKSKNAKLLHFRGSFIKTFGYSNEWSFGVSIENSIDMTSKLIRIVRMTNLETNIFIKYNITSSK